MTGVLAKLAGVNEITVMFPGKIDELNHVCGFSFNRSKSVLNSGGAHTLAAVAFGTESMGRVDEVFGPGNRYVSEAKDNFMARLELILLMDHQKLQLLMKILQLNMLRRIF